MTIQELITEVLKENNYFRNTINGNIVYKTNKMMLLNGALLRGTYEDASEVEWQKEIKEVTNYKEALPVFFHMFLGGYMKIQSAIFAYYFATKVIETEKENRQLTSIAYQWRTEIIFKNLDFFGPSADMVMSEYYETKIPSQKFFDMFMLANVYKGLEYPENDEIFERIKSKIAGAEALYTDIPKVGLHISNSFQSFIIKHFIDNPSFTTWKEFPWIYTT